MRLRSVLAAAALLSAPLLARADTVFDLTSTFPGGATITGTLDIDTANGIIDSVDLTAAGFVSGDGTFSDNASQASEGGEYVVSISGPTGLPLQLILPTSTLVGYSGSSICSESGSCVGYTNYDFFAVSGSLEPEVATTPEPSSFLLLATGLLGVAVLTRRRLLTNLS